jgi:hypothetical protein
LGDPGLDLQFGHGQLYLGDPTGEGIPPETLIYLPLIINAAR